jgi:hypothetical protein
LSEDIRAARMNREETHSIPLALSFPHFPQRLDVEVIVVELDIGPLRL